MTESASVPLTLTDPTSAPTYGDGPLSRWCKAALYDPRDEVFVRLGLKMTVLVVTAMAVLYTHFSWWLGAAYLAMWGYFVPPVILMLHCTMHRSFIRNPRWLGKVHTYAMTYLFGIPSGYTEHHMGMHHVEDNMWEDLSSTLSYRRDSVLSFVAYWARFFFLTFVELVVYLRKNNRTAMARRVLAAELTHLTLIALALAANWRFGLVAFAFPYFMVRMMMMVGNWGQHAFINTAIKNNGFANSITCINSGYNQRCFNDGYHIGHHLKANRHWTEMPQDFLDTREQYIRHEAIVFSGLDFFLVSVLLWTGQWKLLARRFIRLDGQPRSDEDVIAMLKSRVHPIPVRSWSGEPISAPALTPSAA